MPPPSRAIDWELVDILRDYLAAHRQLRRVAQLHRAGSLHFDQVQELVGDGERAVLYRLKERSHSLFRDRNAAEAGPIEPEDLFDLAVGSLFHEAMKFRENFYQRDAYGPKVAALRRAAVPDAEGLMREFEKILAGTDERLEESLEEALALLDQTGAQLGLMLRRHADNGFLTRYLLENVRAVEEAFGAPLDAVLADVHGSAALAYARAAQSYLRSGFFAEARGALDEAASRGERPDEMRRLRCYARGMQAYLEGRYDEALDALGNWIDAEPEPEEKRLAGLALSAVSCVGQLVGEDAGAELAPRAAGLADRIRTLTDGAPPEPLSRPPAS